VSGPVKQAGGEGVGDVDVGVDVRAELPAPPPAPALLAAVGSMQPVATRIPARAFATLLAVGLGTAAIAILGVGVRTDAGELPPAWLIGIGLVWFTGGPLLLGYAVLPRRGHVLPDAGRAGQAAAILAVGLLAFGFLAAPPGENRVSPPFLTGLFHCGRLALLLILPVLIAGILLLRPVQLVGMGKVAAAYGAAGGAWAGVTLHTVCAVGGSLHVGFAHGGSALLGAALGLLLVRFAR
jgi:hypothetical protein